MSVWQDEIDVLMENLIYGENTLLSEITASDINIKISSEFYNSIFSICCCGFQF